MIKIPANKIYSSTLNAQSLNKSRLRSALLSAFSFQLFAAISDSPEVSIGEKGFTGRTSPRPLRIAIAGGGTGGHLFPGIAIAEEFMARNSASRIIFISTGNPLERSVLSKTNFELRCITVAGIKGRGIWRQAISISKIPAGIWGAMRILKSFSPDLTIGLGSYSAGPVVIGAWLLRIPIAVHEQNILPGITNRILFRFADRIYVSFENTGSRMDPKKIRWTGNPVRREIIECAGLQESKINNGIGHRPFTILIIGGSQGAHRINIAVIEALDHLKQKERMIFIHQTGETDELVVKEAYQQNRVSCTVQSFFDNMPEQYRRADLIICRAGATTVAEITALGKAVIFIPYPFAADNHQVLNAASLTNENAADMIIEKNLNGRILGQKIEKYMADSAALTAMAERAKLFGKPDAAVDIVDDCYRLLAA
jgi:UDP-N-acetylglucosamine--N-acetylmuramyl-(pentapeptide) pyrophosphoryl-undecaprenol N-acetylglucosamine transferase